MNTATMPSSARDPSNSGRSYRVTLAGRSRSFEADGPFVLGSSQAADVHIIAGEHLAVAEVDPTASCTAIELGFECLETHLPESGDRSRVIGFARWQAGRGEPSDHIELVTLPETDPAAVETLKAIFGDAGFTTSVSADRVGRIVERLIRPQFNLALRAIDDGLVARDDLDTCLQLGLGYRKGLLAPLMEAGLEQHFRASQALYAAYGSAAYLPPRQSVVAASRLGNPDVGDDDPAGGGT